MSRGDETRKPGDHIDVLLRPRSFDEYVGQEQVKENLRILLAAAKKRKEPPDHLLFFGQSGLGKTTLAHIIASEISAKLKIASGPALRKQGDLAAMLSDIEEGDVLFVDEFHRLGKGTEELLYPALESGALHFVLGKGMGGRMITLDLPPFTLVAATTRIDLLSAPLRSRFGGVFRLDYYTHEEIGKILLRSAAILGARLEQPAVEMLAHASRLTPRIANRLLRRCRDFAEIKRSGTITPDVVAKMLSLLSIDAMGLEAHDRSLLLAILEKFHNRPVGINALSAALGEERRVIEEIYEPYLLKMGLLERTASGRRVTDAGRTHLYG